MGSKIKVTYKTAKGISEAEMQQKLDIAFDILFTEVVESKKWVKVTN